MVVFCCIFVCVRALVFMCLLTVLCLRCGSCFGVDSFVWYFAFVAVLTVSCVV